MPNQQITIMLCDDCAAKLRDDKFFIPTWRRSHHYSFYCAHAARKTDWRPGFVKPVTMTLSLGSQDV